ncbi:MAG: hypothetical protein LC792_19135, partial [Actinobacteria bacterium]|nr:hypothetical protein [Actinomycetota bacterium]
HHLCFGEWRRPSPFCVNLHANDTNLTVHRPTHDSPSARSHPAEMHALPTNTPITDPGPKRSN